MVNFMSYRTVVWNPDNDVTELLAEHAKYQTIPAIGGVQHMCQDMEMGLQTGLGRDSREDQPLPGRSILELRISMRAGARRSRHAETGFAVTPRQRARMADQGRGDAPESARNGRDQRTSGCRSRRELSAKPASGFCGIRAWPACTTAADLSGGST